MTPVGYLLDNHTPKWWVAAVRRENASVRISRVGMPGMPPISATDPELLLYCEEHELVLVTCDRNSMYGHISNHVAAGRVFYGMLQISGPVTTEQVVCDLVLISLTHQSDEYIDMIQYLPL